MHCVDYLYKESQTFPRIDMLTCTGLSLNQWPLPKLCCTEGTDVVGSFSASEISQLRSSFITYVHSLGAVPTGVQQISSKTPSIF